MSHEHESIFSRLAGCDNASLRTPARQPPRRVGRIKDCIVILDLLAEVCHAMNERLASRGVTLDLTFPIADGPRRAARVDAESKRGVAQLLMWETGQLDLVIGDATTGDVLLNEHREVASALGIEDALTTIEYYLAIEG